MLLPHPSILVICMNKCLLLGRYLYDLPHSVKTACIVTATFHAIIRWEEWLIIPWLIIFVISFVPVLDISVIIYLKLTELLYNLGLLIDWMLFSGTISVTS